MPSVTVELGDRYGRPYLLTVSADPDFDRVEDFAVVLFYKVPETERRVRVARIDTAHGFTRLDALYSEEPRKIPFDGTVWEAQAHVEEHWRRYARLHWEHHEG